jgi:hypothetical protein
MKVSSSTDTTRYSPALGEGRTAIEFAIPSAGGNSSFGERHNRTEKAVRLSWWRGDGGYDPISSAELPEWAVMDVMEACAAIDFLSPRDAALLIEVLAASIVRQSPELETDGSAPNGTTSQSESGTP